MAEQLNLRLEPALPRPGDVAPMWPTPSPEPFDSDDHLFEPTWGGHRVLAFVGPVGARRRRRGADRRPGRVATSSTGCRSCPASRVRVAARSAVLDGELVVVDARGRADDDALRERLNGKPGTAGRAPRVRHPPPRRPVAPQRTPLEKRRQALRRVLRPGDEVVVVPAIAGEGRALHAAVTAQGIAGVLARRRTSPYLPGVHSGLWRSIVAGPAGDAGTRDGRGCNARRSRRPRRGPRRCSRCSAGSRSTRTRPASDVGGARGGTGRAV